jgi:hypothetical protein
MIPAALTIIFLVLGYFFGKLTCNNHFKKSGFWITVVLFILINGLHSMIDGISLVGVPYSQGIWLLLGHEMIRQPLLYIIFLGIIAPFSLKLYWRIILSFLAVTVVWYGFVIIGSIFGKSLLSISTLDPLIPYFQLIFVGDIFHHALDWFSLIRKHTSKS